ncbi:primosomal protein N' [Thiohalocapsa sp. ML1]|jgi:primosomal protein N' (replication factor Y) (superfamily II helicase)|uniref:primosomal protein N' n=1 Tax=Thiohalocapsa sp. ML1 TaxID=1431688 RepID=UPI0007320753|nr:primosomal protein N' [Thiohalocapsa sp. ML1]
MPSPSHAVSVLRVAVAAPLGELLDYLPPPGGTVPPGTRVLVPLGRARRVGMVVSAALETTVPTERLKPIAAVIDPAPLLTQADLDFLLWATDYYRADPGEALFGALPVRLRQARALLDERPLGWRAAADVATAADALHRAPRQRELLALLAATPQGLTDAELHARVGNCDGPLRALAARGLIARCRLHAAPLDPVPAPARDAPPPLNEHQAAAVAAVAAGTGFGCFLLDGVTGSGKTEVYLALIERALAAGRQVLVLVPEIGLTPQLQARFARRVPAAMVVLHSALADTERERAWRAAATGAARLLLGTRSAVFTPLPELGLVIVDEEHDLSLKQQEGFRYSARDLAVRRAQQARCPIVLGSATPALETLHNARLGRYRQLCLPERAGGAADPDILVADIRAQPLETGLSHALLTRMDQVLDAGNQVLLFLNRRGFSPVLTCHDCGWISECTRCDARLTVHRGRARLVCHHCGLEQAQPVQCPDCGSPDLRPLGQGTERVEDTLRQRFPGLPLARIDRDSTRRRGELERLLACAQRGEHRILLGTQMLAKGHHLPGVTLVGILDLDHGLYGSDFRATERMAQLLIQVAGRAGRAERAGTVLLQTRHPRHPLLALLLREGYGAFATAALRERLEAGLPPFSHQAMLRADSPEEQAALDFLTEVLAAARPLAPPELEFWGPAPAQMERRAGRIRAQLLLQAPSRALLQRVLALLLPRLRALRRPTQLRWSIDVDPQESL